MTAEATAIVRPRARTVAGEALSVYRRRFGIVAAIGVTLFAPLAIFETAAGVAIHDGFEASGGRRFAAVVLWLGVALLMFGSALCAGFLDLLVGREFGRRELPLRQAARELPYRRLIAVDVLQTVLVGTAALAGFVPGVAVFTLTCLAGPLVMLERSSAPRALWRSTALTSKRFALALVVVSVPVAIEHQVLHGLELWLGFPVVVLWLVQCAAALVVLVPVVLCEIILAYDLAGETFARG